MYSKLSLEEFKASYPDQSQYYSKEGSAFFYISEYSNCPFIGIENRSGELKVYKPCFECRVTFKELEQYLNVLE